MEITWKAPRFTIFFEGDDLKRDSYFEGDTIRGNVVIFVRMYKTPLIVDKNGAWVSLKDLKSKYILSRQSLGVLIHELTKCRKPFPPEHSHSLSEGYHKLPFEFQIRSSKVYLEVQIHGDYDPTWTKSRTKLQLGSADPRLLYTPGIIRPPPTQLQVRSTDEASWWDSLSNEICHVL